VSDYTTGSDYGSDYTTGSDYGGEYTTGPEYSTDDSYSSDGGGGYYEGFGAGLELGAASLSAGASDLASFAVETAEYLATALGATPRTLPHIYNACEAFVLGDQAAFDAHRAAAEAEGQEAFDHFDKAVEHLTNAGHNLGVPMGPPSAP
jgi:hypothetical protein